MAGSGVESGRGGLGEDAQIRTFLIADVRGYTVFTQERGDEDAAKLAGKFAVLAREAVEARGGVLLELRGDEALCVFSSTRQAIRAAVDLQQRFVEETIAEPSLPLTVGIGLDAGEAVPVEGGYRGGALNLAARLCGQARAGEILVTREVTHLARRVDGVRYEDRGSLSLKGLDEPVDVVRVISEELDTVDALGPYAPQRPAPPPPARSARTRVALIVGLVLLVAAAVVAIPALRRNATVGVGSNAVVRLGASDDAPSLATALNQRPGAAAAGFGSLWVTEPDRSSVVRIDLDDGTVRQTVTVGDSPGGIATGEGSVWVTNGGDGTVSRINPETNAVTQTISVGNGPGGVAVGDGAVWVANAIDDTLARMDIGDGHLRTVAVDARPSGVAFTPQGVWVSSSAGATLARVDPRSMAVELTANVGSGPTAVLVADDSVWVTNHTDGTVSRVDLQSGSVIATVPVGEGPNALAATSGSIWVADEFDGTVSALSTSGNAVERTVSLGADLASITAEGDSLWLSVGVSASTHRGGTLRVASSDPLDTLDPAVAYDIRAWGLLAVTNDGLMGFKKTGGAEGATVVPDLAAALPEVSDDGLTYRFEVRPGIRYSTGAPVQPQDFRTAMERAASLSPDAAAIYGAIGGMAGCARTPATCDLSHDIVVDDGSVTFHLTHPDPGLPIKLALPFAAAVPSSVPSHDQRWKPVPATGPYMIERADGSGLTLVRNPAFQEWSPAAQPDGFVDRIEWTFGMDQGTAATKLASGEIDWPADGASPDVIDQLRAAHPAQVVSSPAASTIYIGFDLTSPPFDDPLVRQALNFAVDRAHIVDLLGGAASNRATCQILPPNFQGYVPYCPYTVEPGAGTWSAPDMARAIALIARSSSAGAKVEVWGTDLPFLPGSLTVPKYVVEVLDQLGFDARFHEVKDVNRYFSLIGAPAAHGIQAFVSGWIADYPGAGGFIDVQFRCGAPANASGMCDGAIDRQIQDAELLQTTDPNAADLAWSRVDHALVDQAVWLPLGNPLDTDVFSARVQNVQIHFEWRLLLSRLWVT